MTSHDPADGTAPTPRRARAELAELLDDPVVWAEPPAELEAVVVEAIARASADEAVRVGAVPLVPRRRFRMAVAAAAVAAVLAVVGLFTPWPLGEDRRGEPDVTASLEGVGPAQGARGEAEITSLDNGVRILLDLRGLPPAPPGSYYQGWLRRADDSGVGTGTFHMRGGDGRVVLWAGVSPAEYPRVTVTLERESGDTPGEVVLTGRVP